MAILVVDVQKGFQTQTAECIVLAELVAASRPAFPLLLVLNKLDLIEPAQRDSVVSKVDTHIAFHIFTCLSAIPLYCKILDLILI